MVMPVDVSRRRRKVNRVFGGVDAVIVLKKSKRGERVCEGCGQ